ncbi:MAG: hypothetical protein JWO30_1648 [Fibrobacteres bacterium]|nr:hypothetical protein [Fibrobacterota bacterium]
MASGKRVLPAIALALLLASASGAEEEADSLIISKPVFKVSQEITRVVSGGSYIKDDGLDDAWIEPTMGSVNFQALKNSRLGLEVMLSAVYFAAPYHYDQPQNYTRNMSFSAPRLDASYLFGDLEHPFLKVDVGIFNYKYNENSRDLGEYMFRTWAYPGIIATGGTYAYLGANGATLTGLKLGQSLGMFSHEFLATLETDLTPVYDLNLTYMAKANLKNVVKIGGGVQVARALRADGDKETAMKYFTQNGVAYGDAPGYYKSLENGINAKLAATGASHEDSARLNGELARAMTASAVLDSVSTGQINPDMKTITTMAIKPMLWFSFDPKPLFASEIFGAKDLVLYGEAALLGAKNYPVFYDEIARRIPFMVGFNFPAFKLLDVLSFEVEYYRSRMVPSFRPNQPNASPTPVVTDSYYPADWDKDNLKWSVSAERTLVRGVSLAAQVASDHSRSWDWNNYGKTPWEIYTTPSQYYWGLRLAISI